jgi:type IV conjugative transfer system protein TraE
MDHSILNQNIGKLVGQRNAFLFFSAALSVAVLLLSILLICKSERVVVVPTNGPACWVENSKASNAYVERMGIFLSDLLLNRSPSDVEQRNKSILEHVHPSAYHDFRKRLLQEQESILKGDQAFFFRTENSVVEPLAYVVEGEFIVLVGKNGGEPSAMQKSRKKFTLRFQCENGKILLTSMKKEEVHV